MSIFLVSMFYQGVSEELVVNIEKKINKLIQFSNKIGLNETLGGCHE
jgi:hypothetical protein